MGLEWACPAFPEGWGEHSHPAQLAGTVLSTRGESGDKTPPACELFWEPDAIVLKEFPFSGGPQQKKGLVEKVLSDFMMSH